jgi:hypothetical protein
MPRWFEAVFNTPSHHRVHHGSNPLYLDRNYGGIFMVWDKLFDTFQPELAEEKVRYGLTTNIQTYNPIYIAFHEWIGLGKDIAQSGTGVQDKINYIFRAPGWRHDGNGLTSENLRKNWLTKKRETQT